jgi:hypothetical protein
MSNALQQEEEFGLKALECERIAAELAGKDEPFHRIHLDLAAKWREKAGAGLPPGDAAANLLLDYRRRIAGEDVSRGGLMFVCRNGLAQLG